MPQVKPKTFNDYDKAARNSGLSKEGIAVKKALTNLGHESQKALTSASKSAGRAASSAGHKVANLAEIVGDTVSGTAKEISSGKAGQRILIKPTKAVGHAAGDIWKVAYEQAKKYLNDALKFGKKASVNANKATDIGLEPTIVRPNAKGVKSRFKEEEAGGLARGPKAWGKK